MCIGSEEGSYASHIDFVCHSTLGLRVIKKRKKFPELLEHLIEKLGIDPNMGSTLTAKTLLP